MEFNQETLNGLLQAIEASGQPRPRVVCTPPVKSLGSDQSELVRQSFEKVGGSRDSVVLAFSDDNVSADSQLVRALTAQQRRGGVVLFNTPHRIAGALNLSGFGAIPRFGDRQPSTETDQS